MSTSLIYITGNLTADPELREFGDRRRVTFSVACNDRVQDQESGQWRDVRSTFFNVVCWNQLADNVIGSLHKGQPVMVRGRVGIASWQGQDGGTRQNVEITADFIGHNLAQGRSQFERAQREVPAAV